MNRPLTTATTFAWSCKTSAIVLMLLFAVSVPAKSAAQGDTRTNRHAAQGLKATPGEPGRSVRSYKLDADVSRRQSANPLATSRVIVTLTPGARLLPHSSDICAARTST